MPELSKHELDELFLQGAGRYDIPYNPAAWEKMNAMLERRRRRILAWWFSGLAALLLLSIAAYLCFCHGNSSLFLNESERQPSVEQPRQAIRNSGLSPDNSWILKHPEQPGNQSPQPWQGANSATGREALRQKALFPLKELPPQAPMKATPVVPASIALEERGKVAETVNTRAQKMSGNQKVMDFPPLPSTLPKLPDVPEKIRSRQMAAQPTEAFRGAPSNRLVAGPMFSANLVSIGWGDFSRAGWKAGALAEYQYNGRFGIGLGAQFIRLHYLAGQGEYIPPKGFWTRKIAPDNTRGLCNILEVPVQLKYYTRGYTGNSFFLSAGLSTYFLLMEEYWYHYNQDAPDLIRWWQTKETQSYWFSAGQAAAGYQAQLGSRWAVQLSASLQAPLNGVGHGQVKIFGLGADIKLLGRLW